VIDPPRGISAIVQNDDDNRILECAVHARAHFLVSGDQHHLLPLREFQGVAIVSPAAFLEAVLRGRGALT
jgi:predicted nucleic acid-binding protein